MSTATERPVNFVEGREYPSPVTHVIGFDYYDGVTSGVLNTADGSGYRFDMVNEDSNPTGLDTRTFELAPLPAGAFDRIVAVLAEYLSPNWPVWVPTWTFPTDEIRRRVDEQIDRLLGAPGRPTWQIECRDMTGTVSVVAA